MKTSDLIKKYYSRLTKNDLKTFAHLIQNKEDFIKLNIEDFSKLTGISSSAIVKFSKKLELDGYSELKYMLKWDDEDYNTYDIRQIDYTYNDINLSMNMIKNLDLDSLFQKIDKAKNIFILYTGFTQKNVAEELKRNLLNIDKLSYIVDIRYDFSLMNEKIEKGDIIFAISLNGENESLIDFIKALEKKFTLVSITRLSSSGLSQISDFKLSFVTHIVYKYAKTTVISPISQFYVIIDFLILKYINYKSSKEALEDKNTKNKQFT